jgi:cysteine desulfurase family protein (TIGR01976 family)
MSADLAAIRAQFPALQRVHHGQPVAYFDGPGGTQVPWAVGEAMTQYLYRHNANTHWNYPTSHETDLLLANARQALADFVGAEPEEVAFGANMTTLTFHLARALGRRWSAGDEVIVTQLDHHANVAPWQAVARERGIVLRMVRMDAGTGQLDWADFEQQLSSRTRLIAVGAASNALGTINDLQRAAGLARQARALFFVDAVHFAPHALVDVGAIGCDFLACSAYKFYGPHIGVLYGRLPLFNELDAPKLDPAPNDAPERWETGTQNHEGIVGAGAAVDFLAALGAGSNRRARLGSAMQSLHQQATPLVRRLWEGLSALSRVRVFGPPPSAPRTPTVSFVVEGVASSVVAGALADRGVFVSHGDFYAATIIERLGLGEEGLVRAGCACYTGPDEVERLIAGVAEITAGDD